jgi:putative phosphoesterase
MRLAIISDVHGNLAALDAVLADLRRQKPDLIFHGGDIPYGGCNPSEVIDCIMQEGWPGVLGNTDEVLWSDAGRAVLEGISPKLKPLLHTIFDVVGPATRAMIGEARLNWLRALPLELRHENLVLMHAAPGNIWKAPMHTAEDTELEATYEPLNASIVVYCHIHRPFVRKLKTMTVCNSGSVGMPYDGDPRSSYLLITDGEPEIRRVEYDVEKEVGRLLASNYPQKEWLAEIRRRGAYVPPPEEANVPSIRGSSQSKALRR